jgi:hypothetical protein
MEAFLMRQLLCAPDYASLIYQVRSMNPHLRVQKATQGTEPSSAAKHPYQTHAPRPRVQDLPLAQQYSHVGYALLHSVPTK